MHLRYKFARTMSQIMHFCGVNLKIWLCKILDKYHVCMGDVSIYIVARDRFSSMYWPCISIILVDTLISNWIMWWKTENNNKRIPVVGALSGCSVLIWQDSQYVSSNFFSLKHSKPSLWLKGMPKVEDFKCKRWPRSTIRCGSVVRAFDCRTDDAWWQTLNFAAN